MIMLISKKCCTFAPDFEKHFGLMKNSGFISVLFLLCVCLALPAQTTDSLCIRQYAGRYAAAADPAERLPLANEFFAYLYQTEYIDEPIVFPAGSHIDSVDVNVYYYIAEYHYGEGRYRESAEYCRRAEGCFGEVDSASRSDVYALLGAAYFRMSDFEKAIEALNHCYEIDKPSGDFDRISSTLNSIASAFVAAGKPSEAEKYILEAIAANSLTTNHSRQAVLYGTASEMYKAMGDNAQALSYAEKSLVLERQTGDSARIGVRLAQLANAQIGMAMIDEARHSLDEAMPLLYKSGKLHSWGICRNQMGDILASEGKDEEAAVCYREAAALFLKQGDKYNELHAREGLYRVTKADSPNEAMMHLERSNQLKDSIYSQKTGEAIGKYNAVYYNDLLREQKELAVREKRLLVIEIWVISLLLLCVISIGIWFTYRNHKRKEQHYHRDLRSLQGKYDEANRMYLNAVANNMQVSVDLTEDDRLFLDRLAEVVNSLSEEGITDINSVASQMHVNVVTLRRRLANTVSETPQAYILRLRMGKAKHLLQNYRDITIAEVAERCGYSQVPNFTRAFTRFYGITPSEARVQKPETPSAPPAPRNK